jgi:hypothetical protein
MTRLDCGLEVVVDKSLTCGARDGDNKGLRTRLTTDMNPGSPGLAISVDLDGTHCRPVLPALSTSHEHVEALACRGSHRASPCHFEDGADLCPAARRGNADSEFGLVLSRATLGAPSVSLRQWSLQRRLPHPVHSLPLSPHFAELVTSVQAENGRVVPLVLTTPRRPRQWPLTRSVSSSLDPLLLLVSVDHILPSARSSKSSRIWSRATATRETWL